MSTPDPPRSLLRFRRVAPGAYRADGRHHHYAIDAAVSEGMWRLTVTRTSEITVEAATTVTDPRKGRLVVIARGMEQTQ